MSEALFNVKEVLPILASIRLQLISEMVFNSHSREEANGIVRQRLMDESNILTSHAHRVVDGIEISEDEFNFWKRETESRTTEEVKAALFLFIGVKATEMLTTKTA